MSSDELAQSIIDTVVRLIREEVVQAVNEHHTWKVTVNGSAAGDVRAVIEHYKDVVKNGVLVARE